MASLTEMVTQETDTMLAEVEWPSVQLGTTGKGYRLVSEDNNFNIVHVAFDSEDRKK